jgi:hypothetical protein
MKFSKALAGLGFLVLGSVAFNASAQTPVCTWSGISGNSHGNYSYVTFGCKTSSNVTVATRTDTLISGQLQSCGTVSVSAGYQNTNIKQGTTYPSLCNDIIIASGTPPSSSSTSSASSASNQCNTGYSQIFQTGPGVTPAFNPSACGPQPQCNYNITPLAQHSYPPLKYTCL